MSTDWTNLVRLMSFLKSTRCDRRIIGADSLNSLRTFVDTSYAVHTNMRGHTGGAMTLGWGMVHARASKQKLNAKSSRETEVIGVSEYIPFKIWLTNFLEAHGYKLKDKVLYQDSMSAVRNTVRQYLTFDIKSIDVIKNMIYSTSRPPQTGASRVFLLF